MSKQGGKWVVFEQIERVRRDSNPSYRRDSQRDTYRATMPPLHMFELNVFDLNIHELTTPRFKYS